MVEWDNSFYGTDDLQQQLPLANNPKKYSRLFAIGVFTLLNQQTLIWLKTKSSG